MTTFLQYHILKSYPASNLNRGDDGRPKTLIYGDALRLRISSQSLKRAWRQSDLFQSRMGEYIGSRSIRHAETLYSALLERGVSEKDAVTRIQNAFGKSGEGLGKFKAIPKKDEDISAEQSYTEQLVHLAPSEIDALNALADELAEGDLEKSKDLRVLQSQPGAIDIALFGRMLADQPKMNVEAACQVAHAFTTHRSVVEDDFYTAVDDLNQTDSGAGFLGEHDYGAGVFYLYICLNANALKENLGENQSVAGDAAAAFIETVTQVDPTGKQNSYGSRTLATYCHLEVGSQTPRSLAEAYLNPIKAGKDGYALRSIEELTALKEKVEKVYGHKPEAEEKFNLSTAEGTLQNVMELTRKAVNEA